MKARIIGGLFVLIVLAALFVLTGGENSQSTSPTVQQSQPTPQNPSDADFKGLKIQ